MSYEKNELQRQQDNILRILGLISPYRVRGRRKIRIGSGFDGGYVLLDNLHKITACYSIGIGNNVDFELHLANRGIDVFQYDHTIEAPPQNHERFYFHRMGIAPSDSWGHTVRRLDTMISANGHLAARNMFLKMDAEGNEWSCFDSVSSETIAQFDQIICEFHYFEKLTEPDFAAQVERVFTKLYQTHRVIHVHGNNNESFVVLSGVPVPRILELTLARTAWRRFTRSTESFPTPLDRPCHPFLPDLFLGSFQYSS